MSHYSPTAQPPFVHITAPATVATPVESSRQWTTGLAPRTGGGWNFIAQGYLYPTGNPTEWAVINLETGASTIYEGPNSIYANVGYSTPSANFDEDNAQLRASTGKIYFPLRYTNIAYYDPTTAQVYHLPQLVDVVNDSGVPGNELMRAAVFGQDGHIYGSTQVRGAAGFSPMVWRLKTTNHELDILGYVGNPQSGPTYGYYTAVDTTASAGAAFGWVYIAVGQAPWELWALNIATGAAANISPAGTATHIEFNQRAEGWEASVTVSAVATRYWVANGQRFAGAPVHNPADFAARSIAPAGPTALTSPPELDHSRGFGTVLWRPNGSVGAWTIVTYGYSYREPVNVESLTALPDGTNLLGNVSQYQGFFRSTPVDIDNFGAAAIVSQPASCIVGDYAYLSGYPNAVLYKYDPAAEWLPPTNPVSLGGWFTTANAKYCYFLRHHAANGRIYMSGRRERNGNGSGVGYHVLGTATFEGHYNSPLNFYDPRGLAIVGDLIVVSGEVHADPDLPGAEPASASLLIYDLSLSLVAQYIVQTGMLDTGLVFEIGTAGIVIGVTPTKVYRFNLATGTTETIVTLSGALGAVTQRTDKSIWFVEGGALKKLNPTSLARDTQVTGLSAADIIVWQGDRFVISTDAVLSEGERLGGHRTAYMPIQYSSTGHRRRT